MNSENQPSVPQDRGLTINEDYKWAQTAFQQGEFDTAATLCRRILKADSGNYAAAGMLAEALRQSGKLDQEIEALKSATGPGGDQAGPYLILAGLLRAAGDATGAVETLEQAIAIDPDMPAIRLGLGMAYYDSGDHASAETLLGRAIELDPACAPAHYFMGNIHSQAGDWPRAIDAYSAAMEADTGYHNAGLELAHLLFRRRKDKGGAKRLGRAADLVLPAISQGVGGFEALLLAGKILVELKRYEEAKKVLEVAASRPEKHSDLYVALSVAYINLGEGGKAREISRRLLREYPVGSRPSPRPEAEVLVLEFLAYNAFTMPVYGPNTHAHANGIAAFRPERVSLDHMFIQGIMVDQLESITRKYDVVYNDVANAEVNVEHGYSSAVRDLLDRTGLPVINAPEAIDLTTRAGNYERLQDLDSLIFPRTIPVRPDADNMEDIVERVLAEYEFPLLVRLASLHRAGGIEKVENVAGLRAALTKFAGKSCYVIQYHESKLPTGMFLKYRGIFIGGKFFPGRMNISGNWLVGASSTRPGDKKLIEGNTELQNDEARWLADPAGVIGQANIDALYAADAILGLDNYGMDFGIADDGRVVLFEANPCMNFLSIQRHVPKFPYLRRASDDIKTAMADMMVARAWEGGAAGG